MAYEYNRENTKSGISTRESIRDKAVELLEDILRSRREMKPVRTDTSLISCCGELGADILWYRVCFAQ